MSTGCRFGRDTSVQLSEFKNRHLGEDVYIIGSGGTLPHFDPSFFAGCTTVAINMGWQHHLESVDYMVTKYHDIAIEWKDNPRVGLVVVTRKLRGHVAPILKERDDCLVVEHNNNPVAAFGPNDWPTNPDALVTSYSSITTGMHFAAYMGARRIFMVGADCGVLDGKRNIDGHPSPENQAFNHFERQNRIVKKELKARYGADVVTLLPFSTPNMDGHTFESHVGRLN